MLVDDRVELCPDGLALLTRKWGGSLDSNLAPVDLEGWTKVSEDVNIQEWEKEMEALDDLVLSYPHPEDAPVMAMYELVIEPGVERRAGKQITSPQFFKNCKIQTSVIGRDGVRTEEDCVKNLYGGVPPAWRMPAMMLAPGDEFSMSVILREIIVKVPE
ncbi:uncharacterized protein METZ01_LOCUS503137, partial [marine metagenome]